jgi:hypothetical protein
MCAHLLAAVSLAGGQNQNLLNVEAKLAGEVGQDDID